MKRITWMMAVGVVLVLALVAAMACSPKATATPTPAPTATPTKPAPTATPTTAAATATTAAPTATTTAPTATPTKAPTVAVPTATPTATVQALKEAPPSKSPAGALIGAVANVEAGPGLNRAQAPEAFHEWGVAECPFRAESMEKLVVPQLVASYVLAPDLSKVTLTLQQGVQFHKDYGEMTAADFAWSLNDANSAITKDSIHGQAGDFASFVGEAKAIDKYTVEVPFTRYDLAWASNFFNESNQAFFVLSKAAYDKNGADWSRENVIATGPFQVVSWMRGDKAVLEQVPYKHWRVTTDVKRLTILQVNEEGTRVAMLRTGELDFSEMSTKQIPPLLQNGFKTASNGNGRQEGVFFSGNLWETKSALTGEPLSNPGAYVADIPWIGKPGDDADMEEARNVRRALSMAIDRETIVKTVLSGIGYPNYQQYFDSQKVNNPYWDDKYKTKYDLAAAKELLKKTAWPDGFEIALYAQMPDAIRPELVDAVAGYWQQLGPKMQVSTLKYAYTIFRPTIVGRTNTIPWLTQCDEGLSIYPMDWPKARVMTSLTRGGFGCGLEDPVVADTFLKVGKEPDQAKRIQMNLALVDHMYTEALNIGVVGIPNLIITNPKSIADWKMPPQLLGGAVQHPENIKLVNK